MDLRLACFNSSTGRACLVIREEKRAKQKRCALCTYVLSADQSVPVEPNNLLLSGQPEANVDGNLIPGASMPIYIFYRPPAHAPASPNL